MIIPMRMPNGVCNRKANVALAEIEFLRSFREQATARDGVLAIFGELLRKERPIFDEWHINCARKLREAGAASSRTPLSRTVGRAIILPCKGMTSMMRLLAAAAIALTAQCPSLASADAQTYPTRTVRFIIPFGPASASDITARLFADRLSARWSKPVVVENRPGGDGLVAIGAFTGANDDHTLLFGPAGTFAVHPYEYDKLPYDAERDLLPISS